MCSFRFCAAVLLFLIAGLQVDARKAKRPCKFGDKIEYGHLGEEVTIGDGLDAYVSRPNNTKLKGGVIVIHDIWGWKLSNTRAIVDMLMENNFTAILPDSFRGMKPLNRSMVFSLKDFAPFLAERPASGIAGVVNASIEYLRSEYGITKFAMVGFCWGGEAVQYMAAERGDLVAGVSCYGVMDDEDEKFGMLKTPTLFIYGKADEQFGDKRYRTLRRALRNNATAKYSIRGYEDQPHGFVHRKLASPDDPHSAQIYAARRRMITWLNRYVA